MYSNFDVRFFCFTLFLLLTFSSPLFSQTEADTTYRKVTLKDGNTFTGRILQMDQEKISLDTEAYGTLSFQMSNVRSIELVEPAEAGSRAAWPKNPQATRYLWAPNGYGLEKGEGYYQNIWVLFNQASTGVSDHFSIGAGMVPLFLFSASSTPIWITPKFSIPVKKDQFNLGAGGLFGLIAGEEGSPFGLLYGITTVGSRDRNLSIGLGWGFFESEWADSPTINLSGLLRVGPKAYLVTENYYIDTGDPMMLFSAGGRRMINNFSLDFALAIPIHAEIGRFVAIPFLGFAVPFAPKGHRIAKP